MTESECYELIQLSQKISGYIGSIYTMNTEYGTPQTKKEVEQYKATLDKASLLVWTLKKLLEEERIAIKYRFKDIT